MRSINTEKEEGTSPDLGHQDPIRHDDAQQALTADETAAIRMLAEIFVDAMMRLQQRHGLKPAQMFQYYKGTLDLDKDKEVFK